MTFSWRFLEKNHYEPPRNHHGKPLRTTMNHYEPPRTTMNHHKPLRTTTKHHELPQSLIQNEIWYWILDLESWLNSGSHDIFLRILEKKLPQTTTNHYKPPQTTTNTTNHHKPLRTTTNHYEPRQWTMTVNHDIWTTMNHDEIVSFTGCSICRRGSRRRECTVLEIFASFCY